MTSVCLDVTDHNSPHGSLADYAYCAPCADADLFQTVPTEDGYVSLYQLQLRAERVAGYCADGEEQACLSVSERFDSYVWPGGYPIVFLVDTFNGYHHNVGDMCPACAENEVRRVRYLNRISSDDRDNRAERVTVQAFIHYEGAPIQCDDCGEEIESAYGDPDESEEG